MTMGLLAAGNLPAKLSPGRRRDFTGTCRAPCGHYVGSFDHLIGTQNEKPCGKNTIKTRHAEQTKCTNTCAKKTKMQEHMQRNKQHAKPQVEGTLDIALQPFLSFLGPSAKNNRSVFHKFLLGQWCVSLWEKRAALNAVRRRWLAEFMTKAALKWSQDRALCGHCAVHAAAMEGQTLRKPLCCLLSQLFSHAAHFCPAEPARCQSIHQIQTTCNLARKRLRAETAQCAGLAWAVSVRTCLRMQHGCH